MDESERAIMLGIRHRCGQEVQFWIPARLVASIVPDLGISETLGLSSWMEEEGFLEDEEEAPSQDLLGELKAGLGQRGVALIDVEKDPSICPSCGALLRWLDVLIEYAEGKGQS